MKLYLDDVRPTPKGWVHCRWPQDVIWYLKNESNISVISLDHDLGNDYIGTGYDVLIWIEERVFNNPYYSVPDLLIHSDNSVARKKMQQAIDSIYRRKIL